MHGLFQEKMSLVAGDDGGDLLSLIFLNHSSIKLMVMVR